MLIYVELDKERATVNNLNRNHLFVFAHQRKALIFAISILTCDANGFFSRISYSGVEAILSW